MARFINSTCLHVYITAISTPVTVNICNRGVGYKTTIYNFNRKKSRVSIFLFNIDF